MKSFKYVPWHSVTTNVPRELKDRIQDAADYFGVTRSMLVREVLIDWIVKLEKMKGEHDVGSS